MKMVKGWTEFNARPSAHSVNRLMRVVRARWIINTFTFVPHGFIKQTKLQVKKVKSVLWTGRRFDCILCGSVLNIPTPKFIYLTRLFWELKISRRSFMSLEVV